MHRALCIAFAALPLVASCSGSDDAPSASITSASMGTHPVSAVSGVLHVATTAPSRVSATVDGPGGSFRIPADELATTHEVPVVGMRADSDYTITVRAEPKDDGDAARRRLTFHTGSLPADMPPITVTASKPDQMQPGITVFNAIDWRTSPPLPKPPDGWIIAVDATGAVVWYDRLPYPLLDVDTTRRGTFLVTAQDAMIEEIDLLGNVLRKWGSHIARDPGKDVQGRPLADDSTTDIDVDSTHHEVTELPNGDILTLSTELLHISDDEAKRVCPDNPNTNVVADIAVELSAEGKVVQQWPLSSVYDPVTTPGADMCTDWPAAAPPNWFYPDAGGTRDWTHANAIALDRKANTLVVSLRALDRVIGVRYHDDDEGSAGELLWSLGVDGTIKIDEGTPAYHQHAVELEPDGSLLMYDNGNNRAGTTQGDGAAAPFSRAVRYDVDLDGGTAKQVWEHRDAWPDGRPVFTPFLGDVDLERNGNVLITHGGGSSTTGSMMARIVEVIPGDAPDGSKDQTVFDMTIGDGKAAGGWSLYRSERLKSLYFGS